MAGDVEAIVPGPEAEQVEELANLVHGKCPYLRATQGIVSVSDH